MISRRSRILRVLFLVLLAIFVSGFLFASGEKEQAEVEVPKKLKIVAPKIVRIVTTKGEDIVADWLAKSGVEEIEWVILPWQDVSPRVFREASLSKTDVSIGLLHSSQITPKVAKMMEPLDDYMKEAPIEDFEDIFPGMRQAGTINGSLYAIWFRHVTTGLLYNEEFFAEQGLAGPPQTIEEFIDYAEKLTYTRSDGSKVSGYLVPGKGPTGSFITFSRAWDGDMITPDYKVVCNQKPMVKTISTLRMFYEKGILPEAFMAIDNLDSYTWGQQGRAAMEMHTFGKVKIFNDPKQSKFPGKWKTANVPISESLKSKYEIAPTILGGWGMVIPANAGHKDFAWDFIRFIQSKDGVKRQALNGNGPVRASIYEEPEIKKKIPWSAQEKMALSVAHIDVPPFSQAKMALDVFSEHSKSAIIGKSDPQEAMDKAAAEIEKILKESLK
jgi:multiple sugar transport system substrate-binding protein